MPNDPDTKGNGWAEWSNYVLKELTRLNDLYKELNLETDLIGKNVVEIKTKTDAAILAKASADSAIAELRVKQETLIKWQSEQEGKGARANMISIIAIILTSIMVAINIISALGVIK
jgi:hypothetical protein